MTKGIRGGIVVGVAVLVAVVVYSAVYFSQGLAGSEAGDLGIILVIACALALAALMVTTRRRMLVHDDYLRKFYLSDDTLFNFELGAVPLSDVSPGQNANELAAFMGKSIAGLSYDKAPLDPPAGFAPTYCVSTESFGTGNAGNDWCGELQRIQRHENGRRTYEGLGSFANADEFESLLASKLLSR